MSSRDTQKLLKHVKPGIPLYFLAGIVGVVIAGMEQAVPVKLERLVNGLIASNNQLDGLIQPAVVIAALMLGSQLSRYAQRVCAELANSRVTASLLGRAFACLIARPVSSLAEEHTAVMQTKLDRSARGVAELLRIVFADLFTSVVGVVMAMTLIFTKDMRVGAVALVVVPLLAGITILQARNQAGVRLQLEQLRHSIAKRIAEAFRGLEELKLFRAEHDQSRRLAADLNDATSKEFGHHNAMAIFDLLKSLVDRGGFIVVLGVAVMSATSADSDLGLGGVLMLMMLYDKVVEPIRHLHRIIDQGIERLQLVRIYLDLVKDEPVVRQRPVPVGSPEIRFEDVSFIYPGQNEHVLNKLTATIPAGSVIAVQGRSGCGKSTLQRLLSGLYLPNKGTIKIGDQPVRSIEEIESHVAVLSQSPHIFAGTIMENLRFARQDATQDEVIAAAKLARFHEEVTTFPRGYDYILGESGKGLSGGQKQRLALARIFLVDSPVVVLDEPTAALDPVNSQRILGQLREVFAGKTVVVVTHEPGSLEWADFLLRFDEQSRTFRFSVDSPIPTM